MRGIFIAVVVAGLALAGMQAYAGATVTAGGETKGTSGKVEPTTQSTKDQEYLALVNEAMNGKEPDWRKLRDLYVQTSFYDPYGGSQAIWYQLQRAGQQTVYDPSPESRQEYDTLLAQHYAHFRSHMQAMDMIEKDHLPQSDRPAHQRAVSGIINAIVATGDGKSPETAFKVIDPAEEALVLKTYFHYQQTGQEFRQKEGHFWDVLNYKDPKEDGKTGSLYFNVDQILTAPGRSGQR